MPGLTESQLCLGSESEGLGAVCIGTYWFATRINEITSRTRPASPGKTTNVETCHPRVGDPGEDLIGSSLTVLLQLSGRTLPYAQRTAWVDDSVPAVQGQASKRYQEPPPPPPPPPPENPPPPKPDDPDEDGVAAAIEPEVVVLKLSIELPKAP